MSRRRGANVEYRFSGKDRRVITGVQVGIDQAGIEVSSISAASIGNGVISTTSAPVDPKLTGGRTEIVNHRIGKFLDASERAGRTIGCHSWANRSEFSDRIGGCPSLSRNDGGEDTVAARVHHHG